MLLEAHVRSSRSRSSGRTSTASWGLIEMTRGVPADACQLLLRAATEVAPIDGERALQLLNIAGVAAAYAGDR